MDDILTLNLYSNKSAYRAGVLPTHSASISVKKLVEDAFSVGGSVDGPAREMRLRPVEDDEGRADYFTFSLLPTQLKLPFGMRFYDEPGDEVELDRDYSLVVRISFVPFSELGVDEIANEQKEMARASKHLHDDEDDEDANSALEALEEALEDAIEDDFANMSRAEQRRRDTVALVLRSKLAPGKMPDPVDWKRLSRAVQSLYARLKDDFITQRTSTVTENAPAALFVESLGTDTEVWFFHDEANKDIVVSFRGTEQVSWRDFFTDAQVFLQQWTPGEEIDLRVDPSRTVGLAFMPDCFAPGEVPCDASAVHYGFLRAYLSIRDAILRGLHMLCDGDYANYSFHFTGHSLGGALATIAAVDFRARHLEEDADVCCMSYGAPKVGNVNFARLFNNLVPNSFRIVNDTDLVSRMPRSITGRNVLGKYKHSGRTALVNEVGEYWIQGLNDSTLHDSNCSITNPFRDRFQNLRELLDREKELWEELFSGRSVQHHMVSANKS